MRYPLIASSLLCTTVLISVAAKASTSPTTGFVHKLTATTEALKLLTAAPVNTAVPLAGVWWDDEVLSNGTQLSNIYSFGHAGWDETSRTISFDAEGEGVVATALQQPDGDVQNFPFARLGASSPNSLQISADGNSIEWKRDQSATYYLKKTSDCEYAIASSEDQRSSVVTVTSHKLRQIIDLRGQKLAAYTDFEKYFGTSSIVAVAAPVIDNGDTRSLDLQLNSDETLVIVHNVDRNGSDSVVNLTVDAPKPVKLIVPAANILDPNGHTSLNGHDIAMLVPADGYESLSANLLVIKSLGQHQQVRITATPGSFHTVAADGTVPLALAKGGEAYIYSPGPPGLRDEKLTKITATPAAPGVTVSLGAEGPASLGAPYFTANGAGYYLIQSSDALPNLTIKAEKLAYKFVEKGRISKQETVVGTLPSPDTVFIYDVAPELAAAKPNLYAYLPAGPQGPDCCVAMANYTNGQEWPEDPTSAEGRRGILENPIRQFALTDSSRTSKLVFVFFDRQGSAGRSLDYAIQLRDGSHSGMYCKGNNGLGFGSPWACSRDGQDCSYKDDGISFDPSSACVRAPGL